MEVEATSFEKENQTEEDPARREPAAHSESVSGSEPAPPLDGGVPQLIRYQPSLSKLDLGHEDDPPAKAESETAELEDEPWWCFLLQEQRR